ncbi:gp436 family protein [Actinobacillus pleuropneumoniae]|uniref:Mu-like prophage protein gp36 n=2 Tax=Actinobacillus pleuropneumoniae TaxID=715 RepID=A0A3S4Y3T6_ACTPL|nr:DUF1320 domain-containing protein [Actinobacillus pleuropneumoniae]AWG95340.1 DUF1320 domain-containing protein [Actinobacillus pleuropneumoniae serovar 1 str. 4074]AXA21411.1 DUF1320 domain-containing protein [Actinobacillus pleuropneumoniae]EFL77769.1 hypothetical protein APP2_0819 [Actinobacillus pleuropneumoniae serovar 2 str. 4226]EFM87611.1 hypothetical protein appser2_10210 [Actinobacillus pleuropneumoniae serovar 2 str. S1536]EFM94271.1 hypothetical protein appser9_10170 [Actinobaci
MYINLKQLCEKPGVVELAQVTAQPGLAPISHQVLNALLQGDETKQFPTTEVEYGLTIITRINEVIADSCALIDGYLRQRGYRIPFKNTPRILTTWARAIVRYNLHLHLISEEKNNPIVRDYRDALKMLQLVTEGKFSLGLEDTLTLKSGRPKFVKKDRVFTDESLKDYV